jgi:probable phosphoglycerate mutase
VTRIPLVRHAESEWNRAGLIQGQADAPGLTDAGHAEARRLAARLRSVEVDVVLTSDLRRAIETAETVASVLAAPLVVDRRLRERALGAAEGLPASMISPNALGVHGGLVVDPDCRPSGGESIRDVYQRVAALLHDLSGHPAADGLVVVTHGGVIRVAMAIAAGLSVASMPWPSLGNTAIRHVALAPRIRVGRGEDGPREGGA